MFGRWRISRKKIKDEQSKNRLKKGVKIRLPTIVNKENGKPHAIRTGSEINEIKS